MGEPAQSASPTTHVQGNAVMAAVRPQQGCGQRGGRTCERRLAGWGEWAAPLEGASLGSYPWRQRRVKVSGRPGEAAIAFTAGKTRNFGTAQCIHIYFDYITNKNPISEISIISKENDIDQFIDFINEYDFNLARTLILKQIKKGKVKVISDITFDKNNPKNIQYTLNGSVTDAEIKLPKQSKIENVKFNFLVDQDVINLNEI